MEGPLEGELTKPLELNLRWKTLKEYVTVEMRSVVSGEGAAASEVYPTFNKSTFHLHYRLFLEQLGVEVSVCVRLMIDC